MAEYASNGDRSLDLFMQGAFPFSADGLPAPRSAFAKPLESDSAGQERKFSDILGSVAVRKDRALAVDDEARSHGASLMDESPSSLESLTGDDQAEIAGVGDSVAQAEDAVEPEKQSLDTGFPQQRTVTSEAFEHGGGGRSETLALEAFPSWVPVDSAPLSDTDFLNPLDLGSEHFPQDTQISLASGGGSGVSSGSEVRQASFTRIVPPPPLGSISDTGWLGISSVNLSASTSQTTRQPETAGAVQWQIAVGVSDASLGEPKRMNEERLSRSGQVVKHVPNSIPLKYLLLPQTDRLSLGTTVAASKKEGQPDRVSPERFAPADKSLQLELGSPAKAAATSVLLGTTKHALDGSADNGFVAPVPHSWHEETGYALQHAGGSAPSTKNQNDLGKRSSAITRSITPSKVTEPDGSPSQTTSRYPHRRTVSYSLTPLEAPLSKLGQDSTGSDTTRLREIAYPADGRPPAAKLSASTTQLVDSSPTVEPSPGNLTRSSVRTDHLKGLVAFEKPIGNIETVPPSLRLTEKKDHVATSAQTVWNSSIQKPIGAQYTSTRIAEPFDAIAPRDLRRGSESESMRTRDIVERNHSIAIQKNEKSTPDLKVQEGEGQRRNGLEPVLSGKMRIDVSHRDTKTVPRYSKEASTSQITELRVEATVEPSKRQLENGDRELRKPRHSLATSEHPSNPRVASSQPDGIVPPPLPHLSKDDNALGGAFSMKLAWELQTRRETLSIGIAKTRDTGNRLRTEPRIAVDSTLISDVRNSTSLGPLIRKDLPRPENTPPYATKDPNALQRRDKTAPPPDTLRASPIKDQLWIDRRQTEGDRGGSKVGSPELSRAEIPWWIDRTKIGQSTGDGQSVDVRASVRDREVHLKHQNFEVSNAVDKSIQKDPILFSTQPTTNNSIPYVGLEDVHFSNPTPESAETEEQESPQFEPRFASKSGGESLEAKQAETRGAVSVTSARSRPDDRPLWKLEYTKDEVGWHADYRSEMESPKRKQGTLSIASNFSVNHLTESYGWRVHELGAAVSVSKKDRSTIGQQAEESPPRTSLTQAPVGNMSVSLRSGHHLIPNPSLITSDLGIKKTLETNRRQDENDAVKSQRVETSNAKRFLSGTPSQIKSSTKVAMQEAKLSTDPNNIKSILRVDKHEVMDVVGDHTVDDLATFHEPRDATNRLTSQALTVLQSSESARAVVRQVMDVVATLGDGTVDLVLSPEELGKVRMSFTGSETGLVLVVAVERPETLELLRRHLELLSSGLKESGFEDVTLELGLGNDDSLRQGGSHSEFPDSGPDHTLTETPETSGVDHSPSSKTSNTDGAGLDIRI